MQPCPPEGPPSSTQPGPEDSIGAVSRADKHAGRCLVDTVTSLAGLNDTKLSSGMPGEASSCFV